MAFIAAAGMLLNSNDSVTMYAFIILVAIVGMVVRLLIYLRIPELEKPDKQPFQLLSAIGNAFSWPRFLPLVTYVFLLSAVTAGAVMCFTLAETKTMGLQDGTAVLLANTSLLGGVVGFIVGGIVIDRWGSRLVFVVAHLSAALLMAGFIVRGSVPIPLVVWLAVIHFLLGGILSTVSVAITTEQFAVLPKQGRSVAIAIGTAGVSLGGSLSGMMAAILVSSGMLSESWQLWGKPLGPYDAVLALYAGAVLLLTITLGLVPSVLTTKHELLPEH